MSVQNTAYIRLAVDSEARVRPLLLAIRYLAKHHGLAGGGGGMRMSSYALTMIAPPIWVILMSMRTVVTALSYKVTILLGNNLLLT